MLHSKLDSIIKLYEQNEEFTPIEIKIDHGAEKIWVRFKIEPQRFLPKIFDGDWALTHLHPSVGVIRLVRVIKGVDGIFRVVGRQGRFLYAYPWFK
jgi:hypothetical protein